MMIAAALQIHLSKRGFVFGIYTVYTDWQDVKAGVIFR